MEGVIFYNIHRSRYPELATDTSITEYFGLPQHLFTIFVFLGLLDVIVANILPLAL